jgi:hypothetical protein
MNLYRLLEIAGILLIILYVIPMVQLRAQLRAPGTPHLVPIARDQVEQPLVNLMGRLVDTLGAAGFSLLGWVEGPSPPGARAGVRFIAVLRAPDRTTEAMVRGNRRVVAGGGYRELADVEYTTHFTDDGEVDTNSSTMLGYFIRPPRRVVNSFPDVQDALELYRFHRQLVERQTRRWSSRITDPVATLGEELARLREMWPKEMERQAAYGLYSPAAPNAYRLTWYGAIRGVVLLGTPGKQIRAALRRRRAARLAAELRALPEPTS